MSQHSKMPSSQRRRLFGLKPLPTIAALLIAGSLLFGPSPSAPFRRCWRLAHECLALNAELQSLRADNQQLSQYVALAPKPEGRELLARGRYNLVKKGEWLVILDEKPQPEIRKPTGLRAVLSNALGVVDSTVAKWHDLRKVMSRTRASRAWRG